MAEKISITDALAMLCELFEEPEGELTLETQLADVLGWDSLGTLTIMAEYDDRFDIVLTSDQLEAFVSINDFIQVLNDNGSLTG